MKVTLDTNVLIAAFIARGLCHDLFEHCMQEHEVVVSDFIPGELREKLLEKFAPLTYGRNKRNEVNTESGTYSKGRTAITSAMC